MWQLITLRKQKQNFYFVVLHVNRLKKKKKFYIDSSILFEIAYKSCTAISIKIIDWNFINMCVLDLLFINLLKIKNETANTRFV